MEERPSGWYDDPDEPSRLRYWDGRSWTERTHPKAPMPAPQEPRPPVTRLRPTRSRGEHGEGDSRDGVRDDARESRDTRAGRPPGGAASEQARRPLGADDSPRPWSRGTSTAGRRAGRDRPRHGSEPLRGGRSGDPQDGEAAPAGYWHRAAAYLLDLLIVGVVFLVFMVVTLPLLGEVSTMQQAWGQSVLRAYQAGQPMPDVPPAVLAVGSIMLLIHAGMLVVYDTVLLRRFGATVGCLALGIRVHDSANGGLASGGRLVWRSLLKYAGFVLGARPETAIIGYAFWVVDFVWPLSNPRRLALHDRWSGTRVVRA